MVGAWGFREYPCSGSLSQHCMERGGIAERPWPSPLGGVRLAYRVLPGVAMKWGQDYGLLVMAPGGCRELSRGSHSGWEIPKI